MPPALMVTLTLERLQCSTLRHPWSCDPGLDTLAWEKPAGFLWCMDVTENGLTAELLLSET